MTEPLTRRVSEFLRFHNLIGAQLVVAVSGGPDSVCLLHVLTSLRDKFDLKLRVAHLDHGLREDSAADAVYVSQLAEGLGLPVVVQREDVQRYRQTNGLGLEEAAREVRYRFLSKLAEELDTPYIVTGHTLSDQTETILLHIIRGTGLQGLVGLKPLTPWTMDGYQVNILRPLLEIKRTETENYCRRVGLEPRLDSTNLSLEPLRNRIRLELLPQLKQYNLGIEESLGRLAVAADIDMKYLEGQIIAVWDRVVREEGKVVALDKAALLALPEALQRHLLRRALGRLPGGLKDVEMCHLESIMSSLELPSGRCLDLPNGIIFVADHDYYWLGKMSDLPSPYPVISGEYPLNVPGVTTLPGWQVEATLVLKRRPQDESGLVSYLDLEITGRDLAVRTWKRGDRFVPLGMVQEKKLGEFMIAEKIPRRWRQAVPLVFSPRQIIWLVGHRLDDRAKVTAVTRQALRLEFKKD